MAAESPRRDESRAFDVDINTATKHHTNFASTATTSTAAVQLYAFLFENEDEQQTEVTEQQNSSVSTEIQYIVHGHAYIKTFGIAPLGIIRNKRLLISCSCPLTLGAGRSSSSSHSSDVVVLVIPQQ